MKNQIATHSAHTSCVWASIFHCFFLPAPKDPKELQCGLFCLLLLDQNLSLNKFLSGPEKTTKGRVYNKFIYLSTLSHKMRKWLALNVKKASSSVIKGPMALIFFFFPKKKREEKSPSEPSHSLLCNWIWQYGNADCQGVWDREPRGGPASEKWHGGNEVGRRVFSSAKTLRRSGYRLKNDA